MYATGFLEQKRRSPVSLAAVVGLHASAFALLVLYGTTTFQRQQENRLTMVDIKPAPPPPPIDPPPPQTDQPVRQQQSTPTAVENDTPIPGPLTGPPTPQRDYEAPADPGPVRYAEAARPAIPDPVRIAAEVDPRFRAALQPPYPPNMERLQREGRVQVRITIGTDGRVTAIEQLSSANEEFWRVTQRQALQRWRFRPATVDGRPVVSTMTFTVNFRLPPDA